MLRMTQAPTPSLVYDLIEACAKPGCPLCRVSDRWAQRFMKALLYEEVTDPHTRGRLKKSLGFCSAHAWSVTEVGGTLLGMSIIYRGLLGQMANALGDATPQPKSSWWRSLGGSAAATESSPGVAGLMAQTDCPACINQREMEEAALAALVDALPANERLRTALSQPSSGLCLPHLRRALAMPQTPAAFTFLQESTRTRLTALQAELDEFIRKYDHRFHDEEWGAERDSWERAITWMAGGVTEE